MIVHIKTYDVESLGTSLDWIRERADQLRAIDGLERFEVITQDHPPQGGSILYFSSREAHERYRNEHLPGLEQEIEATDWFEGRGTNSVYRVEEI